MPEDESGEQGGSWLDVNVRTIDIDTDEDDKMKWLRCNGCGFTIPQFLSDMKDSICARCGGAYVAKGQAEGSSQPPTKQAELTEF